jgi:hypothetical protein
VSGAAPLAAACAAGGATPQSAGSAAAEAPAKLLWEIRGGPTYEELVKQGIALFEQKFPRVDIEYFPKEGDWQGKLLAGWASGSGADIFQAWDDNFWRVYANGAVVNVNDLLKDYKKADLDDFVKGQWNGYVIPGTNIRFGVEAVLRLVPGIGDVAASGLSCFLLYEAHCLGVPRHIFLRMVANVAVEGVIGSVPLLGDAFDVAFRANRRNVRLLRDYLTAQG